VLTDSSTPFYGNVNCTTTADGQFMAELTTASSLLVDGRTIADAEPDICPNSNNCTSSSQGYCIQPEKVCSGTYYATNLITMYLPDGWYWTGPPWDQCTVYGGVEAYCPLRTTDVYIPPFI
jgi:hypothetical protein